MEGPERERIKEGIANEEGSGGTVSIRGGIDVEGEDEIEMGDPGTRRELVIWRRDGPNKNNARHFGPES